MIQVTKVWWDGNKLMAEPIDPATVYKDNEVAQPDSTCSDTLRAQGKAYPRTCRKCGKGPCIALANAALDKKAENARELGLDYEPVAKDNSNYRYDPPVAEPVAWMDKYGELYKEIEHALPTDKPLYTTAAQRPFVGLTDDEILKLAYPIRWQEVDDFEADRAVNFAQAIEAKLKEKNNDPM